MFICPCRRNVNVWHVLAALIWGTGGFWSCAISERRGFAWFYNINMARPQSLCMIERNAQGGGNFFLIIIFTFLYQDKVNWACLLFSVTPYLLLNCWFPAQPQCNPSANLPDPPKGGLMRTHVARLALFRSTQLCFRLDWIFPSFLRYQTCFIELQGNAFLWWLWWEKKLLKSDAHSWDMLGIVMIRDSDWSQAPISGGKWGKF